MVNKGWIVTNYDVPVYPTLSPDRNSAIARWLNGRSKDHWEKLRRSGAVACKPVTFKVGV